MTLKHSINLTEFHLNYFRFNVNKQIVHISMLCSSAANGNINWYQLIN